MVRYFQKCKETTALGRRLATEGGTSWERGFFGNRVGHVRRSKDYLRIKGLDILQMKPENKHFWFRRLLRAKFFAIIFARIKTRFPFFTSPISESVYFKINGHRLRLSEHLGGDKGIVVRNGMITFYPDVPPNICVDVQRIARALDIQIEYVPS